MREASIKRWADPDERKRQASRFLGTIRPDSRKLSDQTVTAIRAARASGASYSKLRKMFGQGPGVLFGIIHGHTYRTEPATNAAPYKPSRAGNYTKLPDPSVIDIRNARGQGASYQELGHRFGKSVRTIRRIVRDKSYRPHAK
jgi:hypothetical protein